MSGPEPLVSIVIPAHDAGPEIEPCIRSLRELRFPREDLDIVFVDDGSTDGTGERLDRLAAEEPSVRVIHIPASGGPGRPRNIGLAAARGEYLQFLDADDELTPDSIAVLLEVARRNGSDVVLGKFASASMPRRQDLFTRSRGRTSLARDPQIGEGSLGPCRFFRTDFLRRRGLAFPEGWPVMEDQAFMLEALLAARVVSVYADATCYRFNRRPGEANMTSRPIDPAAHAANLATLLSIVEAKAPDGPLRERLQRRLYRVEVLERLTGPDFLAAGADLGAALVAALRPIARALPASMLATTGALGRARTALLVDGRTDDLVTLASREAGLAVRVTTKGLGWDHGRMRGRYQAELVGPDGAPLRLLRRHGRLDLDPVLTDDLVGPLDVGRELDLFRSRASLVEPGSMREWLLDGGSGLDLVPAGDGAVRPVLSGLLEAHPERIGPGRRPIEPGRWDLVVRWTGLGLRRTEPLRPAGSTARAAWPAWLGVPGRAVVPVIDVDGLSIDVGGPLDDALAAMDGAGVRRLAGGPRLDLVLPVASGGGGRTPSVRLRLDGTAGSEPIEAEVRPWFGRLRLRAPATGIPAADAPMAGPTALTALLAAGRTSPRLAAAARLRMALAWWLGAPAARIRTWLLAAARRLPAPMKESLRRAWAVRPR